MVGLYGGSHEYAACYEADRLGFDVKQKINELMLSEAQQNTLFVMTLKIAYTLVRLMLKRNDGQCRYPQESIPGFLG